MKCSARLLQLPNSIVIGQQRLMTLLIYLRPTKACFNRKHYKYIDIQSTSINNKQYSQFDLISKIVLNSSSNIRIVLLAKDYLKMNLRQTLTLPVLTCRYICLSMFIHLYRAYKKRMHQAAVIKLLKDVHAYVHLYSYISKQIRIYALRLGE